jgi:hypothetical protein
MSCSSKRRTRVRWVGWMCRVVACLRPGGGRLGVCAWCRCVDGWLYLHSNLYLTYTTHIVRVCVLAATLVYVMGTVEDDPHGHVVFFLPLVLDSFLGYAIEQVG